MKENKNISAPKALNRDSHPSQLKNTEYTFCLDCRVEAEDGNGFNITNEPSNYLSTVFESGYKIVGYEKHPTKELTYIFLTNPQTGYSSIGYINHTGNPNLPQDTEVTCEDCNQYSILPTPLEDLEQSPYEPYNELLNDLCNKSLNFNINKPIKHISIKTGKLGTLVYFVDAYNPDRVFDADNIDFYKIEGQEVCGDDNTTAVCVNVERMLQEPEYTIPRITPERLQIGGNLRMGTYQYTVAYCDRIGNEASDYSPLTQPVKIFDENNRILEQTELDSFTNYAVQLNIDNLDTDYKYYKVVVIERVAVNQAESYYELGIFPTTDNSILHSSTQTGTENLGGVTKRIAADKLFKKRIRYEHSKGIEIANNRLLKYGLTGKKFPNLQPIVNLMGGLLKWNSSVAKEGLYKDPIAASKYVGYMREEVQPFAIKFFNKDGSEYPVNPLVARPAKTTDTEIISSTDINLQSLTANATNCSTNGRNQRWQIYNTATIEGTCSDYGQNGQTINKEEILSCTVPESNSWQDGELTFTQEITDLEDYINQNITAIQNPDSALYIPELAPYLEINPTVSCNPNFNNGCSSPELQSSQVKVQDVVNAVYSSVVNEDITAYPKTTPPTVCNNIQKAQTDGQPIPDTAFQTDYALTTVYKRLVNFNNETCQNATQAIDNNPQIPSAYYNNYYGAVTKEELLDDNRETAATNSNFEDKLHKGALWFKINKNNRNKILLEVTANSQCVLEDDIESVKELRYTIYSDCAQNNPLTGGIFDSEEGLFTIIDVSTLPAVFYVTIDAPIVATSNAKFRTAPPCGCFSLSTRSLTATGNKVSFDSIIFEQQNTYTATCEYTLPEINNCDPVPFQYGEFAYWESIDTYPDNNELYDSSVIKVEETDLLNISPFLKQQFKDYYVTNSVSGAFVLNPETTDLRCKPIRHPKFPSNIISPFMGEGNNLPFSEGLIFPLGVHIDTEVVEAFLNIAVKNKLLTQKQRNEISGFEILKGDNTIHKSIVANTVGFDMYRYDEKGDEVLYPNFPLNDLGQDILNLENNNFIQHPYSSNSNYNFSLLGADLSLNKIPTPTEAIISGYQLGHSRVYFSEVEGHSRYILLTNSAKNIASALAIGEVTAELAYKLADLTVNSGLGHFWITAGVVSAGTNAAGAIASGVAIGIAMTIETAQSVIKVAEYRLQWLRTIRDLGQPRNHAAYCAAEGHHNSFLKNTPTARGISSTKNLRSGRYTFIDEKTGKTFKINNKDREYSTFISLGEDYPLVYPDAYKNYDNNLVSPGSRLVYSQAGSNLDTENQRNSAVPYITLKNYIPNQYGTIDSIKWLTTSYIKYLDEDSECDIIYGGTVYISRDYQKRKVPLFTRNAFNQADMTPFNYTNAQNIGTPRFYIDYESATQEYSGIGGIINLAFPDLGSEYNLDSSGGSLYINESAKFYLFYYGIASYLVESEVNANFRYGKRQIKDQYYPDIQADIIEFTQEKNLSIKEPVTYYYNSVYSRGVSQSPYSVFPATYTKEIYDKINNSENGCIYSLEDNSENDLTDPWLIFPPLNRVEFGSKNGKLISVEEAGSQEVLFRFENAELLLPAIDQAQNNPNVLTAQLGSGGLFSRIPALTNLTEIGFAGTQNTDIAKTPYGFFSVDAKRGQVFQRNGEQVSPISDFIGNRTSGLKNWLRKQLPFKILKYFPSVDIDNKYKGIGISMVNDNKTGRILITKRDYIPKNPECLVYDEEKQIFTLSSECGQEPQLTCPDGFTFNAVTQNCERTIVTQACPEGYFLNSVTGLCETQGFTFDLCPDGYTYNPETNTCIFDSTISPEEEIVKNCESDIVFIIRTGTDGYTDSARVKTFLSDYINYYEDQINGGSMRIGIVNMGSQSTVSGGSPTLYTGIYQSQTASQVLLSIINTIGTGGTNQYRDYTGALYKATQTLTEAPQSRIGVNKRVVSLMSAEISINTAPNTYLSCSLKDSTTNPGGNYPTTDYNWKVLRESINYVDCITGAGDIDFDTINFGGSYPNSNEAQYLTFYDDISLTNYDARTGDIEDVSALYIDDREKDFCADVTEFICPENCELIEEECECETTVVAAPCEGTIIGDTCVVPSQTIPSNCINCDTEEVGTTCPEGYTYNAVSGNCQKTVTSIIAPCPPSNGIYAGGLFTQPNQRLWNSNTTLPDIYNGFVYELRRQSTGKIIVAGGFINTEIGVRRCIFRLNLDGSIDNTFNPLGAGFTETLSTVVPNVSSIDIYPDDKIMVVGDFKKYNGIQANGIIRLNADGTKDETFDNTIGFTSAPTSVKIAENGKIVVGVVGTYKNQPTKGLIKLNSDGSIDNTFQGGTRLLSQVHVSPENGTGVGFPYVHSICMQKDGRYLLGGEFREYNGVLSRRIIRLFANGNVDPSFNVGQGFSEPNPPSLVLIGYIYKIQLQGDKILAGGKFSSYKGQPVQGVVRLDMAGNLDPTFNNNKILTGDKGVYDFDQNTAGEILMGGLFSSYDGSGIKYIAKTDVNGFNVGGFTDPNFNNNVNTVLNEPKCEVCEGNCTQTELPDGSIQCDCIEAVPPIPDDNTTCTCTETEDPVYTNPNAPIDYDNDTYFKDVSWTLSYNPAMGSWVSYHNYKPDIYIPFGDRFYSHLNSAGSMWEHPLTNYSFGVFYGERKPFIVEYPIVNENTAKFLTSVAVNSETRRYINDYDFNLYNTIGFNKFTAYNANNNSGVLELVQKKTPRDAGNYPKTKAESQEILYTSEDGAHNINYIYNRVKNINNGLPIWRNDDNMIEKELNMQAVSFKGKKILERLRSQSDGTFLLRFTSDNESRFQIIMKSSFNTETVYE